MPKNSLAKETYFFLNSTTKECSLDTLQSYDLRISARKDFGWVVLRANKYVDYDTPFGLCSAFYFSYNYSPSSCCEDFGFEFTESSPPTDRVAEVRTFESTVCEKEGEVIEIGFCSQGYYDEVTQEIKEIKYCRYKPRALVIDSENNICGATYEAVTGRRKFSYTNPDSGKTVEEFTNDVREVTPGVCPTYQEYEGEVYQPSDPWFGVIAGSNKCILEEGNYKKCCSDLGYTYVPLGTIKSNLHYSSGDSRVDIYQDKNNNNAIKILTYILIGCVLTILVVFSWFKFRKHRNQNKLPWDKENFN